MGGVDGFGCWSGREQVFVWNVANRWFSSIPFPVKIRDVAINVCFPALELGVDTALGVGEDGDVKQERLFPIAELRVIRYLPPSFSDLPSLADGSELAQA